MFQPAHPHELFPSCRSNLEPFSGEQISTTKNQTVYHSKFSNPVNNNKIKKRMLTKHQS